MKGSKIQADILQYLEAQSYYGVNVIAASKSGTHDIIACINSYFFSIEIKGKGDTVKRLQGSKADKVVKAGGVAMVVYSLEEFIELLGNSRLWQYSNYGLRLGHGWQEKVVVQGQRLSD